jgi:gliding motility associated protien GldN
MKFTLILLFSLSLIIVKSQPNSNVTIGPSNVIVPNGQPSSGVLDGVYEKKDVLAKKRSIPYEFVRENDYVWGKRTWSYIDLREKINHPLYYPLEYIEPSTGKLLTYSQSRYSLYLILRDALLTGKLMGYFDTQEPDLTKGEFFTKTGGDAFIFPARRDYSKNVIDDGDYLNDIKSMVGSIEEDPTSTLKTTKDPNPIAGTQPLDVPVYYKIGQNVAIKKGPTAGTYDPSTETTDQALAEKDVNGFPQQVSYKGVVEKYNRPEQVIKYLLKEDWFFDKERSILDVRTIGLAPVMIDSLSGLEKIRFWVYFPQARDVLKNYYVYDAKSTVGGNTYDHLFMTRRFNAVVYKESTLYDRKIEDYRFGADALYESEKVKNTIRTFEHDVWNF